MPIQAPTRPDRPSAPAAEHPDRPEHHPATQVDWDAVAPRGLYACWGHRCLDLVLLAVVLPLALVPGLVIAMVNACVFRSPRQVLFVQPRVGHRGRVFSIFKFRTMRDAARGSMDSWSNGLDQKRVTRFGRFLRNAHLDELPQLLNVLKGDMSFIGPRPEMVEIERWACDRVPGFARRLALRPGISGFAQITQGYTGCDVAAYEEKRAINEYYLTRISLATDLEIVARTVLWMLRGKGWDWNVPASAAESCPSSSATPATALAGASTGEQRVAFEASSRMTAA